MANGLELPEASNPDVAVEDSAAADVKALGREPSDNQLIILNPCPTTRVRIIIIAVPTFPAPNMMQ